MELHNLFPIPIGIFDLGRQLTKRELSFIQKQEDRPNEGNTTSINNKILGSAVMTPLREWLETSVQEYFQSTTNPKHSVNLRITQSWLNYSKPGQFHHKHAHPNSFVSGVFYVQTSATDRIYFCRAGFQQIKFPPQNWNLYNSDTWWFEAVTGRLILFPSSLEHMVPRVEGEQTRISLSFNTFPVGTVGEELEMTGLQLEA